MQSLRFKKALAFLVFFISSILVFNCSTFAQRRSPGMNADGNVLGGSRAGSGGGYISNNGWQLVLNGGYEAPLGDLKPLYKSAPIFGIGVTKKMNSIILSGNVDYRNYLPKEESYPIEVEVFGQTTTVGTLAFSNFQAANIYLGGAYEFLITPSASFYAGVNLGATLSKHTITIDDFEQVESRTISSAIPYIAPKLGLNFALTNRFGFGIETRYNLGMAKANEDFLSTETAPTDKIRSVAGVLFLTYNF